MKAQEILNTLKSLKIGKGCKFFITGNTVSINYPSHKSHNFNGPGQYKIEKDAVFNIYSFDKTGETTVTFRKYDNQGCIQICVL